MAWIEQRRRADGGLTARVFWRPGGRDAPREWETFGAGSDAQNLARADGFKRMVDGVRGLARLAQHRRADAVQSMPCQGLRTESVPQRSTMGPLNLPRIPYNPRSGRGSYWCARGDLNRARPTLVMPELASLSVK